MLLLLITFILIVKFIYIYYFQIYKTFVETGRVAYVREGQFKGKLCIILNVIDQNRVSTKN